MRLTVGLFDGDGALHGLVWALVVAVVAAGEGVYSLPWSSAMSLAGPTASSSCRVIVWV